MAVVLVAVVFVGFFVSVLPLPLADVMEALDPDSEAEAEAEADAEASAFGVLVFAALLSASVGAAVVFAASSSCLGRSRACLSRLDKAGHGHAVVKARKTSRVESIE